MARTLTAAPTDRAMWRRLLRLAHPDHGGSEDLFVWVRELQEHVAGDGAEPLPREAHRATAVAVWDEEGDPTLVGAASRDTKRVLRVRWHAVEAVVGALQCTPVLRGEALWESLRHGTDC